MSDTQAAMREFRFLDDKRRGGGLSPQEEQRWLELGAQLGMTAHQGYYADDGLWYAYPPGYDPNTGQYYGQQPQYPGYGPPQQYYPPNQPYYPPQQGYDPNAGYYDPNQQPAYDPNQQPPYDPNAPYQPPGYYQQWGQPPAPQGGWPPNYDPNTGQYYDPGYAPQQWQPPPPAAPEPAPAEAAPPEVVEDEVMEVTDDDVTLLDSSPPVSTALPAQAPPPRSFSPEKPLTGSLPDAAAPGADLFGDLRSSLSFDGPGAVPAPTLSADEPEPELQIPIDVPPPGAGVPDLFPAISIPDHGAPIRAELSPAISAEIVPGSVAAPPAPLFPVDLEPAAATPEPVPAVVESLIPAEVVPVAAAPEPSFPVDLEPEPVVEPAAPAPELAAATPDPVPAVVEPLTPAEVVPVAAAPEPSFPVDLEPEPVAAPPDLSIPVDLEPEPVAAPPDLSIPVGVEPEPVAAAPDLAIPVDLEPEPAAAVVEPLAAAAAPPIPAAVAEPEPSFSVDLAPEPAAPAPWAPVGPAPLAELLPWIPAPVVAPVPELSAEPAPAGWEARVEAMAEPIATSAPGPSPAAEEVPSIVVATDLIAETYAAVPRQKITTAGPSLPPPPPPSEPEPDVPLVLTQVAPVSATEQDLYPGGPPPLAVPAAPSWSGSDSAEIPLPRPSIPISIQVEEPVQESAFDAEPILDASLAPEPQAGSSGVFAASFDDLPVGHEPEPPRSNHTGFEASLGDLPPSIANQPPPPIIDDAVAAALAPVTPAAVDFDVSIDDKPLPVEVAHSLLPVEAPPSPAPPEPVKLPPLHFGAPTPSSAPADHAPQAEPGPRSDFSSPADLSAPEEPGRAQGEAPPDFAGPTDFNAPEPQGAPADLAPAEPPPIQADLDGNSDDKVELAKTSDFLDFPRTSSSDFDSFSTDGQGLVESGTLATMANPVEALASGPAPIELPPDEPDAAVPLASNADFIGMAALASTGEPWTKKEAAVPVAAEPPEEDIIQGIALEEVPLEAEVVEAEVDLWPPAPVPAPPPPAPVAARPVPVPAPPPLPAAPKPPPPAARPAPFIPSPPPRPVSSAPFGQDHSMFDTRGGILRDDAALAIDGEHRVILHTIEGQVKRGVLRDTRLNDETVGLEAQPGAVERIPRPRIKAIFFMLPAGQKAPAPTGDKLRVTFRDGRQLAGFSSDHRGGGIGFFVVPADNRTNTERIFIYRSSVEKVAVD